MTTIRALLIGSGYAALPVDTSVDGMYGWLRRHDFAEAEVERLTGSQATRDAMLAGLERLGEHDPGDAPVVFYYAGHGHLYRTRIGADDHSHAAYPLLVAIDLDTSEHGTLRSVLGTELSRALQKVARRARNLTVILDCCHASGMVRLDDDLDDDLVCAHEQRLHAEASRRIAARRSPVRSAGDLARPERLSERVVVLTASSAGGRAYPHPGTGRLVFTDALLAALDRHTTWDAVLADVRAQVQAVWPIQHPSVFGPRFRQPLTLAEHLPDDELYRVEQQAAHTVLLAGSMAAIHPRDEFELLTFASTTYRPESVIGVVRPYAIQADRTVLRAPVAVRVPQPCYARRIRRGDRPAVAIDCADQELAATLTRVADRAGFRVTNDAVDARLELRAGGLHVRDCLGELVHAAPIADLDAETLRRCLRRLDAWRGTSRWLRGDSSGRPLRSCYSLRWGLAGEDTVQPTEGALIARPGDALVLELENLDCGAPELYVQAFRARADREIRGWNAETGAQNFATHQRIHCGQMQANRYQAPLDAPPGLPPGLYREWTLVVVSNLPFDVGPLETPIHARALTTGLDCQWGQAMRGPGDDRMVDIAAFPYSLLLVDA